MAETFRLVVETAVSAATKDEIRAVDTFAADTRRKETRAIYLAASEMSRLILICFIRP